MTPRHHGPMRSAGAARLSLSGSVARHLPDIADLRPGQMQPGRSLTQLRRSMDRDDERPRWRPVRWLLILFCLPALALLPLRWADPPITSYMLQSPAERAPRQWVDLRQMGPHLPLAAVAAEDQNFPRHHGFDFEAISEVLSTPGKPRRGASTISQQTAKNLFLWPGGYVRKALEAWITAWLELLWPKSRVLEVYLNTAEFGPGVYGVWAGAEHHFGVAPNALNRRQAAALVALLPSPRRLQPGSPFVAERSAWIVRQMRRLGSGHLRGVVPPDAN